MTVLRIAQAQMPVYNDWKDTDRAMKKAAQKAEKAGAHFLALPEMFCCPYDTKYFSEYAQEEGGPVWQACSSLARSYHLYLSAGSVPEICNDRIYNTAYVFDPLGNQIAKHRKMHLFDINVKGGQKFTESSVLSAGSSVTTFDTSFCTMGLAICYDIRFPELFRLMALSGAEVIFVPASFNLTTGPAHWELLYRSQALNCQSYIIGTAPARDMSATYKSWGHSLISGPWGDLISIMGIGEEFKITEIDLNEPARIRQQIPSLKHRRTDVYTLQIK